MRFLALAVIMLVALVASACSDSVDVANDDANHAWNLSESFEQETPQRPLCPNPDDEGVEYVGHDREECNEAGFGQTGSPSCDPEQIKFDEECGCGCIDKQQSLTPCDVDGCPDGYYCHYEDGECGDVQDQGTCQPLPTECSDDHMEICGCDGEVYVGSSTCAAQHAGVDAHGDVTTCGLLPHCYLPSSGRVQPGYCLVDNRCYEEAKINPDDSCQKCKPERSQHRWSEVRGCRPQVSAGRFHSCAIDEDNQPHCWPSDGVSGGRATPPDLEFLQVSPGHFHSCGIDTSNHLRCWGSDHEELSQSPPGTFWQVSASRWYSCAVGEEYELECWGRTDLSNQQYDPPPGRFVQVSTATEYGCAIGAGPSSWDKEIQCWGAPPGAPPPGVFELVSAGLNHACALQQQTNHIQCWGSNTDGQSTAPDGEFIDVSAGGAHTCAVDASNQIHCWGSDTLGQSSPPDFPFAQVSAGRNHTCGIDTSNQIHCWGDPLRTDAPVLRGD